jgi:hypothetical protein
MAEVLRLSQLHREAIMSAALASAFDKRKETLDKAEDRLGRKFYNGVITVKQRKLIDQLPEDWFCWRKEIMFNVGGRQQSFTLIVQRDDNLSKKARGYLPVHHGNSSWEPIGAIANQSDIETAWNHFDARDTMLEERQKVMATLSAMLKNIRTLKELANIWPEGEAFYAGLEPSKRTLPMPLIRDINAMLGLPR